MIVNNSINIC